MLTLRAGTRSPGHRVAVSFGSAPATDEALTTGEQASDATSAEPPQATDTDRP